MRSKLAAHRSTKIPINSRIWFGPTATGEDFSRIPAVFWGLHVIVVRPCLSATVTIHPHRKLILPDDSDSLFRRVAGYSVTTQLQSSVDGSSVEIRTPSP